MTAANDRHNRETIIRVGEMLNDCFVEMAQEAHRSCQTGSELTGAPGQPVQTGNLRSSIQLVLDSASSATLSRATKATIGTNLKYAPSIEDGVSYSHGGTPMTLRSPVGGFYSFRLTIAGFGKIKDAVVARVKARQRPQ